MKLLVNRKYKKEKYTIGELYINDVYFCNTLEDKDRNLNQSMSSTMIKQIKIMHETAIPTGIYKINMETISPKFSTYPFYKKICNGKLPRLEQVPEFTGILIHVADGPKGADLLSGCIGIGENKIKGGLVNGKKYFERLYSILLDAYKKGETLTIKII